MSPLRNADFALQNEDISSHVTILMVMSLGPMSPVDFKKWPCRPVEFKGQSFVSNSLSEHFNEIEAFKYSTKSDFSIV